MNFLEFYLTESNEKERRINRAKLKARNDMFSGTSWSDINLKDKAKFTARYEFKQTGIGKGKYVTRKIKGDVQKILKQLKKKSKKMKKLMKLQGAKIIKKSQRIKKRSTHKRNTNEF